MVQIQEGKDRLIRPRACSITFFSLPKPRAKVTGENNSSTYKSAISLNCQHQDAAFRLNHLNKDATTEQNQ